MLKDKDFAQIEKKGITREKIEKNIADFRSGFPAVELARPATAGDGIERLEDARVDELAENFDLVRMKKEVIKFVPASGAASRMFKDVFAWKEKLEAGMEPDKLLEEDKTAALFFGKMRDFAFWDDLALVMDKEDLDADHLLERKDFLPLLDFMLSDHGLEYGSLPKGLLAFHKYGNHARTPVEEHLVEGVHYAGDERGRVRIHFTVSPEHKERFKGLLKKVQPEYEKTYQASFDVSYSVQKPSTDTIAVDLNNEPFREKDGSLLFRPGGHGALIENLNDLEGDLVFIKNIDNVVPDRLKEPTFIYKKVIGGLLSEIQDEIFGWLNLLDKGPLAPEIYREATEFASSKLNLDPRAFDQDPAKGSPQLKKLFNRPIRVCGMVKNEGEPGGGPFWVKDPKTGEVSLQIVESSQINLDDSAQNKIFSASTHFNPVDLVCGIKDYKGKKFDLPGFIDSQTGFISRKSKDGRDLKALELPGLWNGAMAYWNTIFVEVPLATFNPVKTVNDLLRPQHQ